MNLPIEPNVACTHFRRKQHGGAVARARVALALRLRFDQLPQRRPCTSILLRAALQSSSGSCRDVPDDPSGACQFGVFFTRKIIGAERWSLRASRGHGMALGGPGHQVVMSALNAPASSSSGRCLRRNLVAVVTVVGPSDESSWNTRFDAGSGEEAHRVHRRPSPVPSCIRSPRWIMS